MIKGKAAYLKKLTAGLYAPSIEVGKEMDGSTPPSVFIGSWNYPRVYAGPMLSPVHGDTTVMDSPEAWIPGGKTQEEIIGYRMSLVRGKKAVDVNDLSGRFVQKLQDISLTTSSVEGEASFQKPPMGTTFSEEHSPFGPSAPLEIFNVESTRWDRNLERAYNDSDLLASDAVMDLHTRGVPFSSIQKALSVGALGTGRRRRMVPTRWSITACDSIIGNRLLMDVRENDLIDCTRVYEFSSLNNYYAVLLLPTPWQYEWSEAFLHVMGREEMVFSDFERNASRKGYSRVGGCYYSCKMGVLEALAKEGRQAGAIVLREAYKGYVPLGVFNVRENVRNAMMERPLEFEGTKDALAYLSRKLTLPVRRFAEAGDLLREAVRGSRQTTLSSFSMPSETDAGALELAASRSTSSEIGA